MSQEIVKNVRSTLQAFNGSAQSMSLVSGIFAKLPGFLHKDEDFWTIEFAQSLADFSKDDRLDYNVRGNAINALSILGQHADDQVMEVVAKALQDLSAIYPRHHSQINGAIERIEKADQDGFRKIGEKIGFTPWEEDKSGGSFKAGSPQF